MFRANILYVMGNSFRSTEMDIDHVSLMLASAILLDVSRTVRDIQMLVAEVLRYVTTVVSMVTGMIGLFMHATSDKAESLP